MVLSTQTRIFIVLSVTSFLSLIADTTFVSTSTERVLTQEPTESAAITVGRPHLAKSQEPITLPSDNKIRDNINNTMLQCIVSGKMHHPDLHKYTTNNTFTTRGVLECWEFCRLNRNCHSLTFNALSAECTVFRADTANSFYRLATFYQTTGKDCMEEVYLSSGVRIREFTLPRNTSSLAKERTGIWIVKKYDTSKNECLGVSVEDGHNSNFEILWKSCKREDLWKVSTSVNENMQIVYKICLKDDINCCLDESHKIPNSICRNATYKYNLPYDQREVYLQVSSMSRITVVFRVNVVKRYPPIVTTNKFDVTLIELIKAPKPCYPSQFQIKNGAIISENSQPFFLPGSNVFIECNKGFGVKKLNFSTIQTVKCTERMYFLPCSRMKCKGKIGGSHEPNSCDIYFTILFGLLTIIFVLIVITISVVMRFRYRRKEPHFEN